MILFLFLCGARNEWGRDGRLEANGRQILSNKNRDVCQRQESGSTREGKIDLL